MEIASNRYGWDAHAGEVKLPNLPSVPDLDGRGESRYIICVEGEFVLPEDGKYDFIDYDSEGS